MAATRAPLPRRKGRGAGQGRWRTHQGWSLCCSCPGRRSDEHCRHHMAACTLQPGAAAAAARDLVRTGMEDPDWVSATAAAAPCPEAAQPPPGLRHPRLLHVKQRRSRDAVGTALRQRFPLLPDHCQPSKAPPAPAHLSCLAALHPDARMLLGVPMPAPPPGCCMAALGAEAAPPEMP